MPLTPQAASTANGELRTMNDELARTAEKEGHSAFSIQNSAF
jgi:hypothetical protein